MSSIQKFIVVNGGLAVSAFVFLTIGAVESGSLCAVIALVLMGLVAANIATFYKYTYPGFASSSVLASNSGVGLSTSEPEKPSFHAMSTDHVMSSGSHSPQLDELMAMVNFVDECVISVTEDEVIRFANRQCEDIFAIGDAATLVGKPFHKLLIPSDHIEFEDYWHQCQMTKEGEFLPSIDINVLREGGKTFLAELFIRKVELDDKDLYVITLKDITDRKKAEAQLQHQVTHDDLTGLPTARVLNDRITRAMARATRNTNRAVVFFLDLNDFRKINEQHGHIIGDAVIRQAALRLQGVLRDADTIIRYGGDEFVVIAEGIEDLMDIDGLKLKLNGVFSEAFNVADQAIDMTCSMGCAIFPEQADSPDALIAIADKQMYRQRNRLKNSPGLTVVS